MISVLLIAYNDELLIGEAISSILKQTYKNFELIIIDDCSRDSSYKIAQSFKDKRIRLFHNDTNQGISKNRNKSVSLARYPYLFFTDTDCIVDKDWLKEGLKTLKQKDCMGVEGFTYYVSIGYKPTLSDKPPGTAETPGEYMTCNMAYKKSAIDRVSGFNEIFGYHSDRELAIKVKNIGKIIYNRKMIVKHQKKVWTIREFVKSGERTKSRVLLYKYARESKFIWLRILYVKNLLKILFPPAIIISVIRSRLKTWTDIKLIPFIYIRIVYERYCIWKTAIKEKIFVI